MAGKKKKYNARFPPARIKKIMQSDEEVGKVAAPVPVIISRALEMFAETLLVRANEVTTKRGARTLTPSHLKFCIESEARFDFLRDLVSSVPDLQSEAAAEGGSGGGEAGGGAAASSWTGEAYAPRGRGRGGAAAGRGGVGGSGRSSSSGGRGRAEQLGGEVAERTPPNRGTGKRRGRPPKILGSMGPGRPKPSDLRFVDDDQDLAHVIHTVSDDEEEEDDGDNDDEEVGERGEGRLAHLSNGHHHHPARAFHTPTFQQSQQQQQLHSAAYQRSFSVPATSFPPATPAYLSGSESHPRFGSSPTVPGAGHSSAHYHALNRSISQATPPHTQVTSQNYSHNRHGSDGQSSSLPASSSSSCVPSSDSHSFVRSLHSAAAVVRSSAVPRSAAAAAYSPVATAIRFTMSAASPPPPSGPTTGLVGPTPRLHQSGGEAAGTGPAAAYDLTVGARLHAADDPVRPPIPRPPVEELDEDYDNL